MDKDRIQGSAEQTTTATRRKLVSNFIQMRLGHGSSLTAQLRVARFQLRNFSVPKTLYSVAPWTNT